jgi:membrane-associated protein
MDYIVSALLSYLILYKYTMLFGLVFFSALILPLPINTLLLGIGAFIIDGYFGIYTTFFVSLTANVLGDSVGYYITHTYGKKVVKKLNLAKFTYFVRTERYIKKHPATTITITRFFSSLGSLVNFLAGIAEVPIGLFLMYDILGNALNIGFFIGLGYFLGGAWENLSDTLPILGGLIIAIFCFFIIIRISQNTEKEL